jgi:glycerophosphoryl diester phosphodiesterase
MLLPLAIAHRGDSSNALENSLAAIHRALSYPADMIELDIRMSRDNVLYVMHDSSTGRTADQSIAIERSTSSRIDHIRLNNGEPVPTLRDVLKAVSGRAGLNLEIKSAGAGLATARYLASSDYRSYVLISSFKEEEVRAVKQAFPNVPTSMIFDHFTLRDVPRYKAKGYSIASLRKTTINDSLVAACHEHQIKVYVWTVDEEDEMRKFIKMKADGIYSNRPGMLIQVRNAECTPHSC